MSNPSRTIRAYLIDPFTRTIMPLTTEASLAEYYRLLKCDRIDAVYIPENDSVLVDDEGLLKPLDKQAFFTLYGSTPLAGYGLVVGTDDEGETVDVKHNIFTLGQKLRFLGGVEKLAEDPDREEWGFV